MEAVELDKGGPAFRAFLRLQVFYFHLGFCGFLFSGATHSGCASIFGYFRRAAERETNLAAFSLLGAVIER